MCQKEPLTLWPSSVENIRVSTGAIALNDPAEEIDKYNDKCAQVPGKQRKDI